MNSDLFSPTKRETLAGQHDRVAFPDEAEWFSGRLFFTTQYINELVNSASEPKLGTNKPWHNKRLDSYLRREKKKLNRQLVVIVGGGFAAVEFAKTLCKKLSASECKILLYNRENHMVFHPLLADVAGASINLDAAVAPLRQMLSGRRMPNRARRENRCRRF